ncbi:hypothetical protein BU15DRAFT_75479 [Melanogaster broomeanus]|nr:hypothetical protein BU15DRAFT_75479 [Melanogaster broomeanus]
MVSLRRLTCAFGGSTVIPLVLFPRAIFLSIKDIEVSSGQGTDSLECFAISQAEDLYIPYNELTEPSRLLSAINQLTQSGLLFVTGIPNEPTSNETCELRKLAHMFGELRTTFYGEMWDVKIAHNSRNIAYTNLDLGLHMDLLRDDPALCGTSWVARRFADGLHVHLLRSPSGDLTSWRDAFIHYINDGHHLHYEHLTIELARHSSPDASTSSELSIQDLNYSPPFQAPLAPSTPSSFTRPSESLLRY